jgi:hypothetical protein
VFDLVKLFLFFEVKCFSHGGVTALVASKRGL